MLRVIRLHKYSRGPPARQWCAIECNITALLGEATIFIPAYACNSPVAPSDLTAVYRDTALLALTQTVLLGLPVAPVAYQVILEPGIGQFREFEPRRVHTRIIRWDFFLCTN